MNKKKMYKVIKDTEGCKSCGHGITWTVMDLESECLLGMSWDDKENAEDMAHFMNIAYQKGLEAT